MLNIVNSFGMIQTHNGGNIWLRVYFYVLPSPLVRPQYSIHCVVKSQ